MYAIVYSGRYKKAYKKLHKSGRYDLSKLDQILKILLSNQPLPKQYQDHQLKGKLKEMRECHVFSDLLLVYKKDQERLLLLLLNLGNHAELFK